MDMLTTRRSMVPAHRLASRSYRNRCLHVWMTSPCGRGATDYTSTPVRQRCSGVRQVAGSIRFPTIQSRSVMIGFFPPTPRNLGIYLDSDASMRVHVSKTVSNCFAALRQITEYTKVCPKAGAGVTGRLSGVIAPRLRQPYPSRSSKVPHRSAAVRTESCCTAG